MRRLKTCPSNNATSLLVCVALCFCVAGCTGKIADGGNIALTAQSDRSTTAKWAGLLEPRDLDAIQVTDFEMIEGGPRIPYTGDCQRTPLGL